MFSFLYYFYYYCYYYHSYMSDFHVSFLNPRWQAVLLTLTSLATCSVADCERQHAHHKVLASTGNNTSFISLMVNSVNDQAKHAFLALQRSVQKHINDNQLLMDKPEKRKLEATITSGTGPSKDSRASAIGLFRNQYIQCVSDV